MAPCAQVASNPIFYFDDEDSSRCRMESHQSTNFERLTISIKWHISEFKQLMEKSEYGAYLKSKDVSLPMAAGSCYSLRVYPRTIMKPFGEPFEARTRVCFLSQHYGVNKDYAIPIVLGCQIYYLDASGGKQLWGRPHSTTCSEHTHQEAVNNYPGCVSMLQEPMNKVLQTDESLLLVGEVELLLSSRDQTDKLASLRGLRVGKPRSQMAAILAQLVDEEILTDCILMAEDTELKAHRCVLAACSPVFQAMFIRNEGEHFKETKTGVVKLSETPNANETQVRAMLNYLYKGKVDGTAVRENGVELLEMATKYQLLDLKTHMDFCLAILVNEKNYAILIILADIHECPMIKKACIRRLAFNTAAILSSPDWQWLKQERPLLAMELLEQLHIAGSHNKTEKKHAE